LLPVFSLNSLDVQVGRSKLEVIMVKKRKVPDANWKVKLYKQMKLTKKVLLTVRTFDFYCSKWFGDKDVGDIVMLVTLWWWLILDLGGRIIILATSSVTDFFRLPKSQTCQQHIWSPTSVTNIDVTKWFRWNKSRTRLEKISEEPEML